MAVKFLPGSDLCAYTDALKRDKRIQNALVWVCVAISLIVLFLSWGRV